MNEQNTIANNNLKQWYCDFITLFREKISKEEISHLFSKDHYFSPCQIEVFWIESPSMQLIVQSNLPDREDKDIRIHGPFTTSEFLSNVEKILNEPRWNMPIKDSFLVNLPSDHQYTYAELLAGQLSQFVKLFKFSLFETNPRSGKGSGTTLSNKIWVQYYHGNIGEEDHDKKIEEIIRYIRMQIENNQKMKEASDVSRSQPESQNEEHEGFATHMFPPHAIGKIANPSIRQILDGGSPLINKDKAFDLKIKNCVVIVNNDGFIFIESKNKENAIKTLNAIMALGIFAGFSLFAVRERDLSHANYDEETKKIRGYRWNLESIRAGLQDFNYSDTSVFGYKFAEMPEEQIKTIIYKAFAINSDTNLMENLGLFVESCTHFNNGEYSQSFIMSWTIIEKEYVALWKNILNDKKISKKRLEKLTQNYRWTIDRIIETLSLLKEITDKEYEKLNKLKTKRNNLYHEGDTMTLDDAEDCLETSMKILASRLTSKS